jgi:CHAD domain-containing protein
MISETDGKKPQPPAPPGAKAYPEHDKLGPLPAPSREPALHPTGDLRGSILAAFRDAIDQARRAAGNPTDLDEAVHTYRKSLRRARAILAMVADDLPGSDADAILQTLRRARRAVSAARDHAVAPKALASLVLDDGPRDAAQQVITAARAAAPDRDEVTRHLVEGADQVAGSADAFAVAVPDLDWPMVVDGVARTYRAARRQLGDAKRSRRAFHAWRRRTKELSYQLALIAAGAGERTAAIAGEVDGLSDELGDVVDLVMLEAFIESHATPQRDDDAVQVADGDDDQPAPSLDDDALEALTDAAETALRDRSRVARRMGKEVFAKSSRRFARRLGKAVRRDLAPPAPEAIAEAATAADDSTEAGATDGVAQPVVS